MSIKVDIFGDKALMRKLDQLEPKVGRKVIRQALRSGAKIVARSAKAKAPVLSDPDTLGPKSQLRTPGLLRREIKPVAGKRKRGVYRMYVMPKRDRLGIPSTSTWYAPAHLEHGTEHIEPMGFAKRAWENTGKSVERRSVRLIRAGILREWKKR